jgi:hypothetical protein
MLGGHVFAREVALSVQAAYGAPKTQTGRLEALWPSVAHVSVDWPVPVGAPARLCLAGQIWSGLVQQCWSQDLGFRVEVGLTGLESGRPGEVLEAISQPSGRPVRWWAL